MNRATSARRGRSRRGAAAVEFAVTAPVLFLLFFGMIEGGRATMVQHLLTNAARDGARTAVLAGSTAEEVQTQVTNYLAESKVSGATVTVTPSTLSTADIGDPISVNVRVAFDDVSWLGSGQIFGGINLDATVVMRKETSSTLAQ